MQINSNSRFVKSFMVGLMATGAGALVALPGAAMPESVEDSSAVEVLEVVPEEALIEPTAEETLPTPDDSSVAETDAMEAAPVAEADAMEEAPVAEAEEMEAAPVAETEEMEAAPVAETEEMEAVPVAETEEMEAAPVAETEEMGEAPVAETEVADTDETEEASAPESGEGISTEEFTIAELTSNSDSFEVLSAALAAADLTEVLGAEGPYTVFAPTDEAFAALPEGDVEQLLLPENKDVLVQVLSYHVVPDALLSTDLETGSVETVEGSEITVAVGDTITVNNANVVVADVEASNGIIHIIDSVIVPPAPEADADIDETAVTQ